jgi:hypothetical protein
MKLYEVDISDSDILIVEIAKNKEYIFQPLDMNSNEDQDKFEDPLNNEEL